MSDLKAPTYKNQCPRGDATCPRRSGLYGPTAIPSRSDIFKRRWRTKDVGPEGADLRRAIPRKSTCPRRSGLYGPTAIRSRSDIFQRHWCAKDVGPEGTDLRMPISSRGLVSPLVGRAFMVRRPSFREATFSSGGGAPKMSDLKAPTYEDRPHREARCPRRSGLYGQTPIPSRSDIFKRRWRAKDVGPEGADLRRPISSRGVTGLL
jgi:hypothetical protein